MAPQAQIQVYTLSDIENWKVFEEYTPRRDWKRYNSSAYDFENWIQINDEDFRRVTERMKNDGSSLSIDSEIPFYLRTALSSPRQGAFCLFRSSLVALFPNQGKYVISPESPHFRDHHLLESINLALFSETRNVLEKTAEELSLPLSVRVRT